MKIHITWGAGEGPTKQAAFDSALCEAGIANYNLIKLSSIIPEGSEMVEKRLDWNGREHGHKLYAVISEAYAETLGEKAVAGIGWTRENNGKGIFVEITGKSIEEVTDAIEKSLESMKSSRPEIHGEAKMKTAESECRTGVACAVVAAVYKSEGWE